MADSENISWLLEGPTAWNKKRRDQDFIPDLSGEDIAARLLDAGIVSEAGTPDLSQVNLSKALLSGCNFSGVFLNRANLSGADLGLACFKKAQLLFADLTGANLQGANLTDAHLIGAKLGQAYLEDRKLDRANFADADLVGANLTGSRFWRASMRSILSRGWENYPHACLDGNATTINDVLKHINKLKEHYASDKPQETPVFYHRAESKDDCDLTPNMMRRPKDNSGLLRDVEEEMLVDLRARRAGDFGAANSALDQMIVAQHHGLPTRLLDVTRNPLVALFHASQDLKEYPDANGRIHLFAVPRSLVKPFNSDTIDCTSLSDWKNHPSKSV